jgi:hypothetical protein
LVFEVDEEDDGWSCNGGIIVAVGRFIFLGIIIVIIISDIRNRRRC